MVPELSFLLNENTSKTLILDGYLVDIRIYS